MTPYPTYKIHIKRPIDDEMINEMIYFPLKDGEDPTQKGLNWASKYFKIPENLIEFISVEKE